MSSQSSLDMVGGLLQTVFRGVVPYLSRETIVGAASRGRGSRGGHRGRGSRGGHRGRGWEMTQREREAKKRHRQDVAMLTTGALALGGLAAVGGTATVLRKKKRKRDETTSAIPPPPILQKIDGEAIRKQQVRSRIEAKLDEAKRMLTNETALKKSQERRRVWIESAKEVAMGIRDLLGFGVASTAYLLKNHGFDMVILGTQAVCLSRFPPPIPLESAYAPAAVTRAFNSVVMFFGGAFRAKETETVLGAKILAETATALNVAWLAAGFFQSMRLYGSDLMARINCVQHLGYGMATATTAMAACEKLTGYSNYSVIGAGGFIGGAAFSVLLPFMQILIGYRKEHQIKEYSMLE